MAVLVDTFYDFAAGATGMDGRGFVKCLRHGGLIDEDFSTAEADLVFTKCKPKGLRKIDFDTFLRALKEVAIRKDLTDQQVQNDLCLGSGYSRGERLLREQSSGDLVGPERFFYDTAGYTGTHKHGGPHASGSGIDFRDLVNRDRRNESAGPQRNKCTRASSTTYQEPLLTDRAARPIVTLKGPERFFYDKSTYTGTHRNGGPDSNGSGVPKQGYHDLKELVCREHIQNDGLNRRRNAATNLIAEERRSPRPLQNSSRKMSNSPQRRPSSAPQVASKTLQLPASPRFIPVEAAGLPVLLGSVAQRPGLAATAAIKLHHEGDQELQAGNITIKQTI